MKEPTCISDSKILYVVFDQDTKEDVTQPMLEVDAKEICDAWNKECHEAGGSSTQYGFTERIVHKDTVPVTP